MTDVRSVQLGDTPLASGAVLRDAFLAYQTRGSLNAARDNAIVMPTYYGGQHSSYLPLLVSATALDPSRYFIIIPNMFGNGQSCSPSSQGRPEAGEPFPIVSIRDNVMAQSRLVFEHLGVAQVALACGWSMGGMQAYQWAALFPDRVQRLLAVGSAARTCAYNGVFLQGLKAGLLADGQWRADGYKNVPEAGIRAFARIYLGWAYSEEFFRKRLYQELGFATVEALMAGWEQEQLAIDARDLLAMLETWLCADLSDESLRSIRARTMLVACSTDRYFPVADNIHESSLIPHAELRLFESAFGHCAFSPGKVPAAMRFLSDAIADLLLTPAE